MNKFFTKISAIAILLFVFQIGLTAQPVGSQIKVGTDSHISYWNGIDTWMSVTPDLPGKSLQFAAGVPTWVNNPNGITTTAASSITGTTAVIGGNILSDGGAAITARGVCWSTTANPTVALSTKTTDGNGIGSFTSNITGLAAGTTYFVRAYATNSAGTAYGNEVTFTTILQDYDGNLYNIVTIGTQTWMAENLKTTHYNNGTAIPNVTDNAAWASLTIGAYCDYNNTPSNSNIYGRLYNWFTVNTGNLCPTGWHVPTDAEWTVLENYLGGSSVAGGKLKEVGLTHWQSPNTGANNVSGFNAIGSGYRFDNNGNYSDLNIYTGFWTNTVYAPPPIPNPIDFNLYTLSSVKALFYSHSDLGSNIFFMKTGLSVRCLKN